MNAQDSPDADESASGEGTGVDDLSERQRWRYDYGLTASSTAAILKLGPRGDVLIRNWAVQDPTMRLGRNKQGDARAMIYDFAKVKARAVAWREGRGKEAP